ncbi:MAG: glycosyltransferase [Armatimonadetes bacterium]|nr:glycosyltransferase [Armatimonadota bacterium]
MKPLRIAIFSDSALPVRNGVSISINSLIQELRNQGHSVHIFAPRFPGHQETDPNTIRFRAMDTPWSKGHPIAYPPFWRKLRRFRKHEFDVIHTHTPFIVGFVGLRWAESHEIPIVSTYHTLYDRYAHYMSAFPRRYIRFRVAKHTNFYYNSVDQVITPTEVSRRWLLRHGVERPITVIPTGVPKPQLIPRAEARQQLEIPPDQRILLYVGRLAKEKNLSTLLGMAKIVTENEPRTRLWLVGDGPYREECLALASKHGIGDKVRFVGSVPRYDVDRYYAAADLFTFASVTETQGLVLNEAMQYGIPAVVVDGGGASEAIVPGENGFATKNDEASLAESVLSVLESDELYTRLCAGAERTAKLNTTEAMCNRVLEVYNLAIDQGRVRHESEPRSLIS